MKDIDIIKIIPPFTQVDEEYTLALKKAVNILLSFIPSINSFTTRLEKMFNSNYIVVDKINGEEVPNSIYSFHLMRKEELQSFLVSANLKEEDFRTLVRVFQHLRLKTKAIVLNEVLNNYGK